MFVNSHLIAGWSVDVFFLRQHLPANFLEMLRQLLLFFIVVVYVSQPIQFHSNPFFFQKFRKSSCLGNAFFASASNCLLDRIPTKLLHVLGHYLVDKPAAMRMCFQRIS